MSKKIKVREATWYEPLGDRVNTIITLSDRLVGYDNTSFDGVLELYQVVIGEEMDDLHQDYLKRCFPLIPKNLLDRIDQGEVQKVKWKIDSLKNLIYGCC